MPIFTYECICAPNVFVVAIFWGQLIHFHKHANQNKRTFEKRRRKKMRKFNTFELENSLSPLCPPLQLANVRVSFTFQTTEKKKLDGLLSSLVDEVLRSFAKKKYFGIMLSTMSRRNLISFIFGPLDWVSISIYNPSRHSFDLDYGR